MFKNKIIINIKQHLQIISNKASSDLPLFVVHISYGDPQPLELAPGMTPHLS